MIIPADFLKWCEVFNIPHGGGGGAGVTAAQVQQFAFNFQEASGADDAFIVSLSPAVTTLTDGFVVTMSSGALQNLTATPTLQVSALTPVPIELWAGQVAPGDIQSNASYIFIYNSAANVFKLINPSITTADAFLVQANSYNAALDSGAANAYVVTLTPEPQSAFTVGFPVYMQVGAGNTNTGASTLTVNGVLGGIVNSDNTPLAAGAIVAGQTAWLLYSANYSAWVLMNPTSNPTFRWSPVSGTTQACAVNTGYITNNAAQTTYTAPAAMNVGDEIIIKGVGTGGWIMTANTGQTIRLGTAVTTTAGTVTSANGHDSFKMTCLVANTTWSIDYAVSAGLVFA